MDKKILLAGAIIGGLITAFLSLKGLKKRNPGMDKEEAGLFVKGEAKGTVSFRLPKNPIGSYLSLAVTIVDVLVRMTEERRKKRR